MRTGVPSADSAFPVRPTRVNVLGTSVDACTSDELVRAMCRAATQGRRMIVAYANAYAVNLAYENPDLRDFFNRVASVVFCDGFGVKWGARLLGGRLPERLSPPDWIDTLAANCARQGLSLYLLGGQANTAERAAQRLRERHPQLRITGWHHGYFDPAPNSASGREVLADIARSDAAILLVGMGMPRQELWLRDVRESLQVPVALTVGALFDYLADSVPRAPRWMTDHGMEWIGRLVVEPARLWKRYIVGLPKLALRLLGQRAGWIRVGER